MEAPEKIYLDIRGFENVDIPFSLARKRFGVPYYEHPVSTNDVEYTRTDVIVERAEKYLHEHLVEYWSQRVTDGSKFIDDFRKYMKGE